MPYADRTDVPVTRSQSQINDLLRKRGAEKIALGWSAEEAQIGFYLQGRSYRFTVPTAPVARRSNAQALAQLERSRWRVAHLVIKAKLEAVEAGVTTIEQEFLAYTVMPNGQTVYEATQPAIEAAYSTGRSMPLLAIE